MVSPNIEVDTFTKWSFISAMACTGAYFDTTMGSLQRDGEERKFFKSLSRESATLGHILQIEGLKPVAEIVEANIAMIDKLAPDSTASMQKDLKRGMNSEIQGMLFDIYELGKKHGFEMPTYEKAIRKLN